MSRRPAASDVPGSRPWRRSVAAMAAAMFVALAFATGVARAQGDFCAQPGIRCIKPDALRLEDLEADIAADVETRARAILAGRAACLDPAEMEDELRVAACTAALGHIPFQTEPLAGGARATTLLRRGRALLALGLRTEAEADFDAVLALDPEDTDALHALVEVDAGTTHPLMLLRAARILARIAELEPNSAVALRDLARAEAALGADGVEAARRTAFRALDLLDATAPSAEPRSSTAMLQADLGTILGATQLMEGRADIALDMFRLALERAPGDGVALAGEALSLAALGQTAAAEESLARVIAALPGEPRPRIWRAILRLERGEFRDALSDLFVTVAGFPRADRSPEHIDARTLRAVGFASLGHPSLGLSDCLGVLALTDGAGFGPCGGDTSPHAWQPGDAEDWLGAARRDFIFMVPPLR